MHGEHVHAAVVASGVKVSGCTVHFADNVYDSGPIILQRTVAVAFDDSAETLAAAPILLRHELRSLRAARRRSRSRARHRRLFMAASVARREQVGRTLCHPPTLRPPPGLERRADPGPR